MGTRNLTMVISNGETKVAQYGQWDGYPDGQGKTALEFLRGVDLEKFKERLKSIHWLTKEQSEEIDKLPDWLWQKLHPYLSRDRGADILNLIMHGWYESGRDKLNMTPKNFRFKRCGGALKKIMADELSKHIHTRLAYSRYCAAREGAAFTNLC